MKSRSSGTQMVPRHRSNQVGVGGLAAALVSWLCHCYGDKRPFVVTCEPIGAPCLLASISTTEIVQLKGDLTTIMVARALCEKSFMSTWTRFTLRLSNAMIRNWAVSP